MSRVVFSSVKAALQVSATRLLAPAFAETLHFHVHDPTHRHFRSTVEYRPKMTPASYSETRYVLPKRLTTTYVSCVSGPDDPRRRHKWYRSSIDVQAAATVSNAVVVVVSLPCGQTSSGCASENDNDGDERL